MASKNKSGKSRLDLLLVERGLAASRQKAQAMILAGEVRVNGRKETKAGAPVPKDAAIEVTSSLQRFASRGGLKLDGALDDFAISAERRVCLDVGSSTGGFTDCLLQHGAKRVYAVDVTVSQLAWKLQKDARVVQIEKNARQLEPADFPEPPELVTLDVSFISVEKVLGPAVGVSAPGAEFLVLVKPQFELEREAIGKGGLVSDPRLQERAVERVKAAATTLGLEVLGVRPSRVAGAEGNQEFFLRARRKPVQ